MQIKIPNSKQQNCVCLCSNVFTLRNKYKNIQSKFELYEMEILEFNIIKIFGWCWLCLGEESRTKSFRMKIEHLLRWMSFFSLEKSDFFYSASKTRKTLFKCIFVCSPYVNGRFFYILCRWQWNHLRSATSSLY